MIKPCPVCEYPFTWKRWLLRNWLWAQWRRPRCNSKLGYDANRRVLLVLVIMAPYMAAIFIGRALSMSIPVWGVIALLLLITWGFHRFEKFALIERRGNFCINCRYDLTGNPSGICPECGTPTEPPP
ncbi:MAG: hypothetical protein ACYSUQ_11825 [Planctomycetota bacterium]|jgi:hypothetical protein